MNTRQNLVNSSKYSIKCPYSMIPEFIVVHNTANDASAENEVAYMIRNNDTTSFHYAVDDKEIVQGIPENRNAWHAGDGGSGKGNRKGIAIEICYSKSGGDRFIQAEKNAAQFIAQKLKEKGWGIDEVKKHQDFMNKYCPHRTLDMGWERFLNMIRTELGQAQVEINNSSSENKNTNVFNDGLVNCIYDVQGWLNNKYGFNLALDNIYGPDTKQKMVMALQTELNKQFNKDLAVDGIFGANTKNACINVSQGAEGNITMLIQMALFIKGYNLLMDKIFGSDTTAKVKQFQKANALSVDGIVGKNTFEKLFK